MQIFLFFALWLLAGPWQAWGATTYTVCASGCDETTIQGCSTNRAMTSDDVCLVASGTYGPVTWNVADIGTSWHPVVVRCADNNTCSINAAGGSYGITSSAVGLDYVTFRGFAISNYTSRGVWLDGASGVLDNEISLIDITTTGGVDGVWVRNKQGGVYRGLVSSGHTGYGFSISNNGTAAMTGNTVGGITTTGGGTSNTLGAITIVSQDNLTIDDDITVNGSDATTAGLSFRSVTGTFTVNSDVTLAVNAAGYNGIYIDTSTALLHFNGILTANNGLQGSGVSLTGNTFTTGSYINRITATDNTGNGVGNSSSNITFKSYHVSGSSLNNIAQSAGSGILYTSDLTLGYGLSILEDGLFDGFSSTGTSNATIEKTIIRRHGGGNGIPANEGDGITGHDTSLTYAKYNFIYDNDNTCMAFIGGSTAHAYHNTCVDNGMVGGSRGSIWTDNDTGVIDLQNNIIYGGLPYSIVAVDATALATVDSDTNIIFPDSGATAFALYGATPLADIVAWRTASGEDATSQQIDPLLASLTDASLRPNSPAINAGAIITGIHDLATPATDIKGISVLTIPDIGAYEYPGGLYFNAAAADGGNGTRQQPYNAWTDYTWTGYNLRGGAEIYLQGAMGTLDLSGLTDTVAKTVKAWPRHSGSITGFVGGPNDKLEIVGPAGNVFKGAFQ